MTIVRQPNPAPAGMRRLAVLPRMDLDSPRQFQVELQSADLSGLKLGQRGQDLLHADFDSRTRWPDRLPAGFDPQKIMELGRDPGLGVRALHRQGILGQKVGIAIIDLTLLTGHVEYAHSLRLYEELPPSFEPAGMHGAMVASIATGRTVGVAPEADLYYLATTFTGRDYVVPHSDGFKGRDFTWAARAVDRVLEVNSKLAREKRIRVLSMSVGWVRGEDGYQELCAAVERARRAGIFVISSSLDRTYQPREMYFHGLGRPPLADPNQSASYGPGHWWERMFAERGIVTGSGERLSSPPRLLVPMDSRCTAAPTGVHDYVFYRHGGWSMSIPYLAGLYALACQVQPNVTPQCFWKMALKTGERTVREVRGTRVAFGVVINPLHLLKGLQGKV